MLSETWQLMWLDETVNQLWWLHPLPLTDADFVVSAEMLDKQRTNSSTSEKNPSSGKKDAVSVAF